jgi:hypothetical protein
MSGPGDLSCLGFPITRSTDQRIIRSQGVPPSPVIPDWRRLERWSSQIIGTNLLDSCTSWPHNIWAVTGIFAVFLLLSACAYAKRTVGPRFGVSRNAALTTHPPSYERRDSWLPLSVHVPRRDANQTHSLLSVARSLNESKSRPCLMTAQSGFFSKTEPISGLTLTRSFGSLQIFRTGKLTTTNRSNAGNLSVPNNAFSNLKPEPAERRVLSSIGIIVLRQKAQTVPVKYVPKIRIPTWSEAVSVCDQNAKAKKFVVMFNCPHSLWAQSLLNRNVDRYRFVVWPQREPARPFCVFSVWCEVNKFVVEYLQPSFDHTIESGSEARIVDVNLNMLPFWITKILTRVPMGIGSNVGLLACNKNVGAFLRGISALFSGIRSEFHSNKLMIENEQSYDAAYYADDRSREISPIKKIGLGIILVLLCWIDWRLLRKITDASSLLAGYGFMLLTIFVWIPIPFVFAALWS